MTPPDDVTYPTRFTSDEHSLIGPYVVDALTEAERESFEAHLSECERCRAEVAELREPLAELASEVSTPPPPALRASVLAAIRGVEQEAAPAAVEPPKLVAVPTTTPDATVVPAEQPEHDWAVQHDQPPTDELALRRSRRLSRGLAVAVAAVAVMALALGGWVANLNQQRQQQVATQQAAQAEQQRYTDLLAAPDAKVYAENRGDARYSFVVSKSRNEALFLGTNLPDPGAGNVYQLWTIAAAPLMDRSVVGSGSVRQWFSGPVDDSAQLAVNVEPSAGPPVANTPTGEILSAVKI